MDIERRRERRRGTGVDVDDDATPISLTDFFGRHGTGEETEQSYHGLKIMEIDSIIKENTVNHNTDEYNEGKDGEDKFVVRRGCPFLLKIVFSRPLELEKDRLRFVFKTGKDPLPGGGTYVSFNLWKPETHENWKIEILGVNEKELSVGIHTPPDCLVSKWQLDVQIVERKDDYEIIHKNSDIFPIDIYILFNPWNKDDTVFLEDDSWRREYILNDEGAIWVGKHYKYRDWSFKQFDKDILDCTLYLLDTSYLKMRNRGNAVLVSRALSRMGNEALTGRWNEPYDEGIRPSKWEGSAKILQKYFETKQSVKYGQCWVFSGILTTMCRAIGIPCRCVTNFTSAHDTDGSITIDEYYTLCGYELEGMDSVWNFHVWNEVWMDRPDLPKEYGGWQAIDCTPQEESEGQYQCGPVSVAAIKAGDLSYNYDGPFVFAEVNADRVVWMYDMNGDKYLVDIQTDSIGRFISTRAVPSDFMERYSWYHKREDLTNYYKYSEGSNEERDARIAANRFSKEKLEFYKIPEEKSVQFKLDSIEDGDFGEDFTVKVWARNTMEKPQSIYGFITTVSSDYRGKPKKLVKLQSIEEKLEAMKEDKEFELKVTYEDYHGKLVDGCYISVLCCFITRETQQGSICKDIIQLNKPKLNLKVFSEEIEKGQIVEVGMDFTNPLKIPLTECEIDIEGSGFEVVDEKQLKQADVAPKERFSTQIAVKATKKGERKVIASFNAKEIYNVSGTIGIIVNVPAASVN